MRGPSIRCLWIATFGIVLGACGRGLELPPSESDVGAFLAKIVLYNWGASYWDGSAVRHDGAAHLITIGDDLPCCLVDAGDQREKVMQVRTGETIYIRAYNANGGLAPASPDHYAQTICRVTATPPAAGQQMPTLYANYQTTRPNQVQNQVECGQGFVKP